jgi:plasmid maintenance system antidote protein VapI
MQEAIHIGKLIEEVFTERGLSGAAFARAINKTRQNIYPIFKSQSIDSELLCKISEVLNHDFFQYYQNTLNLTGDGKHKTVAKLTAENER